MKINEERLWTHIQELGKIGKNENGSVTRLAFTKEDESALTILKQWMLEAGLDMKVDACGNLIGTLYGKNSQLPPILCGSHFDSVKQGGIFDGCLGVLSGIEILQTMREHHYVPEQDIKVVGFRDEEGCRFGYGMVGSHAICGNVDETGLCSVDEQGNSLETVMYDLGYSPQNYKQCRIFPIQAYYELHIEQANLLNKNHCSVGIVTGIAGLDRYTIEIKGRSAHAGATPMSLRTDPVVAMSQWIDEITKLASSYPSTVATIGAIYTYPGACNVICDRVVFTLDLRSLKDDIRNKIMEEMKIFEQKLEKNTGISVHRKIDQSLLSLQCDENLQKKIKQNCEKRNCQYMFLVSGAGHDCMNFKGICPTAMIFVASKNEGASHCLEEYSAKTDCALGCQILLDTIKK